jgi:hypothetical protein
VHVLRRHLVDGLHLVVDLEAAAASASATLERREYSTFGGFDLGARVNHPAFADAEFLAELRRAVNKINPTSTPSRWRVRRHPARSLPETPATCFSSTAARWRSRTP